PPAPVDHTRPCPASGSARPMVHPRCRTELGDDRAAYAQAASLPAPVRRLEGAREDELADCLDTPARTHPDRAAGQSRGGATALAPRLHRECRHPEASAKGPE